MCKSFSFGLFFLCSCFLHIRLLHFLADCKAIQLCFFSYATQSIRLSLMELCKELS
jgi:hypothetical protein